RSVGDFGPRDLVSVLQCLGRPRRLGLRHARRVVQPLRPAAGTTAGKAGSPDRLIGRVAGNVGGIARLTELVLRRKQSIYSIVMAVPWAFSPRTSSVGIHELLRTPCRFPWMPGTRACPRAARSADPWAGHDDEADHEISER